MPGKEKLIELAVDMGLGYPSQLKRWSAERLKEAIEEADNGLQEEEKKEEVQPVNTVWIERDGDTVEKPLSELQAHLDVGWRLVK